MHVTGAIELAILPENAHKEGAVAERSATNAIALVILQENARKIRIDVIVAMALVISPKIVVKALMNHHVITATRLATWPVIALNPTQGVTTQLVISVTNLVT